MPAAVAAPAASFPACCSGCPCSILHCHLQWLPLQHPPLPSAVAAPVHSEVCVRTHCRTLTRAQPLMRLSHVQQMQTPGRCQVMASQSCRFLHGGTGLPADLVPGCHCRAVRSCKTQLSWLRGQWGLRCALAGCLAAMATYVTCKLALGRPDMAALVASDLLYTCSLPCLGSHSPVCCWSTQDIQMQGKALADLQRVIQAASPKHTDAGHLWRHRLHHGQHQEHRAGTGGRVVLLLHVQ